MAPLEMSTLDQLPADDDSQNNENHTICTREFDKCAFVEEAAKRLTIENEHIGSLKIMSEQRKKKESTVLHPIARVERLISRDSKHDNRHYQGIPGAKRLESRAVWEEFVTIKTLLLEGVVEANPGRRHELRVQSAKF